MQTRQQGAVTSIWEEVTGSGWEQWLFFTSDDHFDSIQCNRDLLRSHLDQAVLRRAWIFIFGDWFDAMQGRFDPRRSMDELRPEYRSEKYYDLIVNDAGKFLAPYAEHIKMMGKGNHENGVLKNANTDMISRLAYILNMEHGGEVLTGGYGGWIRILLSMAGEISGHRVSVPIKYFHGSGGEAPVTRGAIQTNRQAVYLPDAEIVVNGHSHNAYYIPIERERISAQGVQYFDTQHHLRIPGYKQGYADGQAGWEVERGGVPKPLGSWFVRLTYLFKKTTAYVQITPIPVFDHPEPVPSLPGEDDSFELYAQDSEYP